MDFQPIFLAEFFAAGIGVFFIKILVNAIAVFVGGYLLRGVSLDDFVRALFVAGVLALLNATLGAVLHFVAFPLEFITLGLFSLVIDAIVLMIADYFLKGFEIKSFWWALGLAAIIAIVNALLGPLFY